MLVIKMQEDDMLVIGDDIRVYVRQVSGGGVKLCVDAPREVPVTRLAAPRDEVPRADAAPEAVVPEESGERPARQRRARESARRV
jgi:carbon storage regulator CsrA